MTFFFYRRWLIEVQEKQLIATSAMVAHSNNASSLSYIKNLIHLNYI
jgi:hypothetical protein